MHDATSLENQHGFKLLDDKLQELIRESKSDQILRKLDDLTIDDQKKARSRLLESLEYRGMNARINEVSQASTKTFEWVLESDNPHHWSSFTGWLNSQEQIYLISGKPGSGKSTLMKYLIQNRNKIVDKLPHSAQSPRILWYFLWNSGTIQQRSFQGLLAVLLLQILMEDDTAVNMLLKGHNSKAHSTLTSIERKTSLSDWSVNELEATLMNCIKNSQHSHIIFLDGLDEIDESYGAYDMSQFVLRLCEQKNIKACVSSRPWKSFRESFGSRPRLDLHQLNLSDIRDFVFELLDPTCSKSYDGETTGQLSETISVLSEGVFLWAILTARRVRSQMSVLNLDEIYMVLQEMPKDMEKLYEQIWKRHEDYGKRGKEEAAFYFHMLLEENERQIYWFAFREITLFSAVACAMQLTLTASSHDTPFNSTYMSEQALLRKSKEYLPRIEEISAGFIEISYDVGVVDVHERSPIRPSELSFEGRPASISDLKTTTKYHLHWTHRSAREFIQETVTGREIISKDRTTYSERHLAYFRSHMLLIHLWSEDYFDLWYLSMRVYCKWVSRIEKNSEKQELLTIIEKAHTSMCDFLPRTIEYSPFFSPSILQFLPFDHSLAFFGLGNLLQYRYVNESITWPKSYVTEVIGSLFSGFGFIKAAGVQINNQFAWLFSMDSHILRSFRLGFQPTQVVPLLLYIENLVSEEGPDPGPEFHHQYLRILDLKYEVQDLTANYCLRFSEYYQGGFFIRLLDQSILYDHTYVILELDLTSYVTYKLKVSTLDERSKQVIRQYVCTPRARCVKPIIVSKKIDNNGRCAAAIASEENCPAALSKFCLTFGTDQSQCAALSSEAIRDDIDGFIESKPSIPDYELYVEERFGIRRQCDTNEVLYRHSLEFHRENQLE